MQKSNGERIFLFVSEWVVTALLPALFLKKALCYYYYYYYCCCCCCCCCQAEGNPLILVIFHSTKTERLRILTPQCFRTYCSKGFHGNGSQRQPLVPLTLYHLISSPEGRTPLSSAIPHHFARPCWDDKSPGSLKVHLTHLQ
jgi:hypothetical protein